LFFAVVRFSPPSQETEAAKRKAEAKNNSPDSQEPIFNFLVVAKGEARGRAGFIRVYSWFSVPFVANTGTPCNGDFFGVCLISVIEFSIMLN